jgi:hypothetical protein
MAILTIHHWEDPARGLRELRRVARDRVVVLTYDMDAVDGLWLLDYLPEALDKDRERFPAIAEVVTGLGRATVDVMRIPADCQDGFMHAYLCRPEAYLDPTVRAAQSGWHGLPPGAEDRAVTALARDLESGAWDERHDHWRNLPDFDGGLRLIVSAG